MTSSLGGLACKSYGEGTRRVDKARQSIQYPLNFVCILKLEYSIKLQESDMVGGTDVMQSILQQN